MPSFLRIAWEFVKRWYRSGRAAPYLSAASEYIESRLDLLPGDFDVEADTESGMVYYRYVTKEGVKFTITLTTGKVEDEAARLRDVMGSTSRDITIDLSEIYDMAPGDLLPKHVIDLKMEDLLMLEKSYHPGYAGQFKPLPKISLDLD